MDTATLEERYRSLRRSFIDLLPERLEEVKRGLDSLQVETTPLPLYQKLFVTVHGLVGTSATFGFPALSAASLALASQFKKLVKGRKSLDEGTLQTLKKSFKEIERIVAEGADPASGFPGTDQGRFSLDGEGEGVFLVSKDETLIEELTQRSRQSGHTVHLFESVQALQEGLNTVVPVGVVIDLDGEDPPSNNTVVPLRINRQFARMSTPVPVMVIAGRRDLQARLWAVRLGNTHFFSRPVNVYNLVRELTQWEEAKAEQPYRVMVLDDDPLLARLYGETLESAGMVVSTLTDPFRIMDALSRFKPELLILDLHMHGCNGIEIASVIRQHPVHNALPVLFLSGAQNLGRRLSDRNLAHEDYLIKPVHPLAMIRSVINRIERLRSRSKSRDHLRSVLRELENLQFAMNRHAIVSVADVNGLITYVNDKFCDISGFSRKELIGKNHRIVRSGYHDQSFFEGLWGTIGEGRVWHGEIRNRRKDGAPYWVAATIIPFLDDTGKPYEYVSIRTDITAQKNAEERTRSMALFAEMNPAPVLRIGPDGSVVEANAAAHAVIGADSIRNKPLKELMPGIWHVDFETCISHDENVTFIAKIGERYFQFNVQGVSDLRVAHVYGNDVTEQKKIEETLRERDERIRAIVDSAVEGIIVADEEGMIELFNPGAEKIFGYERESMLGRNINLLMPPPHNDEHHTYISSFIDTGSPEIMGGGREVEGVRQNGKRVPISLSLSAFRLRSGRRFTAVVRDITERKRYERELKLAKETAEKASRAKSEFLSGMSHELRTPMNAILGFSQLLESDPDEPLSEAQLDSVQEIRSAGDHLLELINEILDLAKIEAGRLHLNVEDVALGEVLDESLNLMEGMARTRGIQIEMANRLTNCNACLVEADRVRLKQVVLNLLSNAIKYNRENGSVRMACTAVGDGFIRLDISDTGHGIASERINEVFEPFHRLEAEGGSVEGTGIGLVITRQLIEHMGGKIGLESVEGEGSTFWVTLKLIELFENEEEESSPESGRVDEPVGVEEEEKAEVLYIEDNPANVKLVERLLKRRSGVTLSVAADPHVGLDMAFATPPDLILLDLNLPGLNGYQVLERLREQPETRTLPVIAVSANAMPRDVERGLKAGFADYVTKPIDVERFFEALDRALDPEMTPQHDND
ncbi:MAG: PAS domain S-box protein [Magnetococcales bacterium]|nr:PAS domain S-box protein [Magnetococcales bacterium]